jgi:hypothetical protein
VQRRSCPSLYVLGRDAERSESAGGVDGLGPRPSVTGFILAFYFCKTASNRWFFLQFNIAVMYKTDGRNQAQQTKMPRRTGAPTRVRPSPWKVTVRRE